MSVDPQGPMPVRGRVLTSIIAGVFMAACLPATAADAWATPRAVQGVLWQRSPWSGCYAGPGVGTVPGRMAVHWTPNTDGFPDSAERSRLRDNGSGRLDGPGFVLGGQTGCNWQLRRMVWGAEVDGQRTNLDEARDADVPVPGVGAGTETYHRVFGSDWTATFRARGGWLVTPTVLVYATGGLATADADTEDSVVLSTGGVNAVAGSERRMGWTAGGGVEWTITEPRSIRVSYLYADFGSFSTTSRNSEPAHPLATIAHTHALQQHLVVVWVSFHF